MMVPYKSFGVRDYTKAIARAINTLQRSSRAPRLGLFQKYDIHVKIGMQELTPSPTAPTAFAQHWGGAKGNEITKGGLSFRKLDSVVTRHWTPVEFSTSPFCVCPVPLDARRLFSALVGFMRSSASAEYCSFDKSG
ncbi:hypothetical protein KM043_010706 [Ampulex compressa]|nr:hypothetical protein KM043_010706 [Ampulex compressa]